MNDTADDDPTISGPLPEGTSSGGVRVRTRRADSSSDPSWGSAAWKPPTPEDLDGEIPGCEIRELIGRGGMGAVYRGVQTSLDRTVAIKILNPILGSDETFEARFRREAKSMALLSHANIVHIHDFGQSEEGLLYIVMEYVDGPDLRHLIRGGNLTVEDTLRIALQICNALSYAHEKGIIHRDLKPGNVFVTASGDIKIGDFGLAKLAGVEDGNMTETAGGGDLTIAGVGMGTPNYIAPEQAESVKEVDHRADIYSFGVIFYEMLTGQIPRGAVKSPSEISGKVFPIFDPVVFRAIEHRPEDRYPTATDLKNELERIRREHEDLTQIVTSGESSVAESANPDDTGGGPSPSQSSTPSTGVVEDGPSARKRMPAGLLIAGGAVIALLLGWVGWQAFQTDGNGNGNGNPAAYFSKSDENQRAGDAAESDGDMGKAVMFWEKAADGYENGGELGEALQLHRKLAEHAVDDADKVVHMEKVVTLSSDDSEKLTVLKSLVTLSSEAAAKRDYWGRVPDLPGISDAEKYLALMEMMKLAPEDSEKLEILERAGKLTDIRPADLYEILKQLGELAEDDTSRIGHLIRAGDLDGIENGKRVEAYELAVESGGGMGLTRLFDLYSDGGISTKQDRIAVAERIREWDGEELDLTLKAAVSQSLATRDGDVPSMKWLVENAESDQVRGKWAWTVFQQTREDRFAKISAELGNPEALEWQKQAKEAQKEKELAMRASKAKAKQRFLDLIAAAEKLPVKGSTGSLEYLRVKDKLAQFGTAEKVMTEAGLEEEESGRLHWGIYRTFQSAIETIQGSDQFDFAKIDGAAFAARDGKEVYSHLVKAVKSKYPDALAEMGLFHFDPTSANIPKGVEVAEDFDQGAKLLAEAWKEGRSLKARIALRTLKESEDSGRAEAVQKAIKEFGIEDEL